MKKIKYLPIALAAMICFYSCSDDDKAADIPVTGIEVTEATAGGLTVKALETVRLTVTVLPENASYKRVLFESINPEIMTVTQDGVIKGLKTGNTTLRVFAADGGGASVDYPVYVDYDASVINVKNPGTLSQLLASQNSIISLKLAGTLNDADFETLTGLTALQTLDLSLTTVTAIPDNAFYSTGSIQSIILPATIASVGENAFRGCTDLTSVTLNALTPPETAITAFSEIDRGTVRLTVPNESYEAYREAEVYGEMTINGVAPVVDPNAFTLGTGLQVHTFDPILSTSDTWTLELTTTWTTDSHVSNEWGSPLLSSEENPGTDGRYSKFQYYVESGAVYPERVNIVLGRQGSSNVTFLKPDFSSPVTFKFIIESEGDGKYYVTFLINDETVDPRREFTAETLPRISKNTNFEMTGRLSDINTGGENNAIHLTIPAASAVGQWQTVTLDPALSTADEWTIVSVNTQPTDDINKIQFGESGWGVHLFSIDFTGSVSGKGNPPFEFYLGGPSQGGTKVGAIGRGNWNSSTQSLTPYAIALNKPVIITLTCAGDGAISCTVQNEGVNDGEPVDFGTMTGVETVTAVKAAVPVTTEVTITMKK